MSGPRLCKRHRQPEPYTRPRPRRYRDLISSFSSCPIYLLARLDSDLAGPIINASIPPVCRSKKDLGEGVAGDRWQSERRSLRKSRDGDMRSLSARAPRARRPGGVRRPQGPLAPSTHPVRDAQGPRRGAAAGGSGSGRRVLVVDDSRDGADSLAALLGLLGYRVTIAYDGPGALEAALASRP